MPPKSSTPSSGQPLDPKHLWVGVACLVALPVATWFLLGDMSEPGGRDQMYAAPTFPRAVEALLGAIAGGTLFAGLAFLIPRTRHSGERAWWPVFGVLALAELMLAFGLRVMTARVGGANIGGGLFLMYGLPVIVGLVIWALGRAWHLSAPPKDF